MPYMGTFEGGTPRPIDGVHMCLDSRPPPSHTGYAYTPDLVALDSCHPSHRSPPHPALARVTTPLKLPAWRAALSGHPDPRFVTYILDGIEHGFRIGFERPRPLRTSTGNCPSAEAHPQIVVEYIQKEVMLGRFIGPFTAGAIPHMQLSKFGVIPKGHTPGKWRLITDLSSPKGQSVNDGIAPPLCSLRYVTVDDIAAAAAALGRGALIAKLDVESAYRIVPVHPDDRPLLGVKWRDGVYIDAMLPFGLRSAPKIFTAIADALEWVVRHRGTRFVWHYIDDFIVCGPPKSIECACALDTALTACSELGVPISAHKVEGLATDITVLGIRIDTVARTLSLPTDKLQRLQRLLTAWGDKKSCSRRELESLVGLLNHACKVVRPGRSFLRRMLDLLRHRDPTGALRPHHFIRLNCSFRADLQWWRTFVAEWNGVSVWPDHRPISVEIVSDASGAWGCGAYWHPQWFQIQWSARAQPLPIAVKELLPVIVAVAVWGPRWGQSRIRCHCDNQSVVHDIRSRTSRHPHMMHLLRCLVFLEARYQIELICVHIPGVLNDLADDLSQDRLSAFLRKVPKANCHPTPVPQQLIDLLMEPSSSWLSPTWTNLFGTTASRA